jgi:hypothetical protein
MTAPRNPEFDLQIMLVETERIDNMLDSLSRFESECPVCAISQSLYVFRRNISFTGLENTHSNCEMSCPAYKRCMAFVFARRRLFDELLEIQSQLSNEITQTKAVLQE